MSVAEDLSNEIKAATGEETIVSDLTYDLRSGSADFVDRMVASTFAGMAMDAIEEGKHGLMTAINSGCYAHGGDSRPQAGAAPRGCRHHVQHRPLPPDLRPQAGAADLPDAGLRLELEAACSAARAAETRPAPPHTRAARAHSGLLRPGGGRRGAFPFHHRPPHLPCQADSRAPGPAGRPPRAGRGLRQRPLRARAARSRSRKPRSGDWTFPRRCCALCRRASIRAPDR